MKYTPEQILKKAKEKENFNREIIKSFKRRLPGNLDELFHQAHFEVFERIICLDCANCCRSLGPRITDKDIERLSKYLKMKQSAFTKAFLRMDEDGDYVFREMPCPFLESDNKCRVYDQRPKACREYPHTDRKKIHQILDITLKNSYVCPAVIEILDELKVLKS